MFVDRTGGAIKIAHCDAHAAKLGLFAGLNLADAHARVPDLTVVEADGAADQAFVERLAELCERFTPLVALDPPHGIVLDLTGCTDLFGGEARMTSRIAVWTSRLGFMARLAVAGTPDAARALVRFADAGICPEGAEESWMRRLTVAALETSDETRQALTRSGFKCLGDLADRPSRLLSARFGQDLIVRLHRILGKEDRRISPVRIAPSCCASANFPEPLLDGTALQRVLDDLIRGVSESLDARGEGGRVFEASFFRSDGDVRRIAVETGKPSRNVSSIVRLFQERLETLADPVDPGFGFDAVRLSVLVSERLVQKQPEFGKRSLDGDEISDLVDRLTVRFGKNRVRRLHELDSHDPARSETLIPASGRDGIKNGDWSSREEGEPPFRPIKFFEPPQPIVASLIDVPDGPPRQFQWRKITHVIAHAEGPERIAPEWWAAECTQESHDYYRVEDSEGRRFWIFRVGGFSGQNVEPKWFLRGLFA